MSAPVFHGLQRLSRRQQALFTDLEATLTHLVECVRAPNLTELAATEAREPPSASWEYVGFVRDSDGEWTPHALAATLAGCWEALLTLPAGDAWAAYGAGAAGLAATATFTNGGAIFTLTFAKVAFPRKPISVDRPEIMIPFEGQAYKAAGVEPIVCTLNVGP